MKLVNILIPLREPDVKKIRRTLKRRRFEFAEREYEHFTAKKGRLHVTVYEKGPKALVQGNEARDFAREVLEPLFKGRAASSPPN
jgi:ribonuclease HIII